MNEKTIIKYGNSSYFQMTQVIIRSRLNRKIGHKFMNEKINNISNFLIICNAWQILK